MATTRTVYESSDGFYMSSEVLTNYWEEAVEALKTETEYKDLRNIFTKATKDSNNGWYKVSPDTGVTVAQLKKAIETTLGTMRGSDTVTFTSAEGENFA